MEKLLNWAICPRAGPFLERRCAEIQEHNFRSNVKLVPENTEIDTGMAQ
jgi:hypothetical protein